MDLGAGPGRADWLLLFLSREPLGITEPQLLDPVRIQKGLFLLSVRGPAKDVYAFKSYSWGPFSADIYRDLDLLQARGLVESERIPSKTWVLYRTTNLGEERAHQSAARLDHRAVEWLAQARRFVTVRSFERLLRDIYAAYPQFADKSLLK